MSTKRETENVKIEKAVPGGGGPGGQTLWGKTDRKSGAGQAQLSPPPRLLIK